MDIKDLAWRTTKILAFCSVLAIGLAWLISKAAPPVTPTVRQSQPSNPARRLLAKGLENDLLRSGFDVQVSFIEEDDSRLIIYGKSVNRPFARNLMVRADFNKLLHDGKFTEVTFMDSMTAPDFSQVFQVK
jgi:hypothetical protein